MRILFVTVDYPDFLTSIYRDCANNIDVDYRGLLTRRNASLFSRADYVTDALADLGHVAEARYVNNLPLQRAWHRENQGQARNPTSFAKQAFFKVRRLGSHGRLFVDRTFREGKLPPQTDVEFDPRNPEIWAILEKQITQFRPDIVYSLDPVLIDGHFLASLKPHFGKLAAQIAAPYPADMDWTAYDLVLSSLPNFVERFQLSGVPSAYLPLYFAPQVREEIGDQTRDIPISFVGSVMRAHGSRRQYLERMTEALPVEFYGTLPGEEQGAPLAKSYRGPAWGRDMYAVLGRSQITLNSHIDIAQGYANNLRLFEATGMGACLVTDSGRNLSDLFEPGREVLAYDSTEECIDLCRHYLAHPRDAAVIADAGQRRCMSDYTVQRHAEKMAEILQRL